MRAFPELQMHLARRLVFALVLAFSLPAFAHDWNDGAIRWRPFDAGLAEAKKAKKPVCLVVFTEWCPHCRNYAQVFHDPKVVEQAKKFVMIRVNKDEQPDVSRRYAPDGEYIPRTHFLDSQGTLDASIHAPRPQFLYFLDERRPEGVLQAMDAALAKKR